MSATSTKTMRDAFLARLHKAMATDDRIFIVSDDFGLLVEGVRHEGPGLAAVAASGRDDVDGWSYWSLVRDGKTVATLQSLRESNV